MHQDRNALLNEDETARVMAFLQNDCRFLAVVSVHFFLPEEPNHSTWIDQGPRIAILVRTEQPSVTLSIFDLQVSTLEFQLTIASDFRCFRPKPCFLILEGTNSACGLNFINNSETAHFEAALAAEMTGQVAEGLASLLPPSGSRSAPGSPRNGYGSHPKRHAPPPPSEAVNGRSSVAKDFKRRAPDPPRLQVTPSTSGRRSPKRQAPSPPVPAVELYNSVPRADVNLPLAHRPLPPLPANPPPVVRRLPPPPPPLPELVSARRPAPPPPTIQEPKLRKKPPPPPPDSPYRHLRKSLPPPRPPTLRSTRHATLPASLPSRASEDGDRRSLLLLEIANFDGNLRQVKDIPKTKPPQSGPPTMQDLMMEAIKKRREVLSVSDEESEDEDDKWVDN